MSTREIKENISPKLLAILANEANINIQKNKYILETIQIYKNQINEIKNIFKSNKEENNNVNKKTKINIISEYITKLNSLKNNYNKELKKIKEKDNEYTNKLFNNFSLELSLENLTSDNFILENTLQKLDSELSRYRSQLKAAKMHNLFRQDKRDSSVKIKDGEYIIYDISIDMQRDMLLENRAYNKCINKNNYYKRKIKEKNKKIEILKNFIDTTKKKMNKLPLLKKYESSANIFAQEEDYNKKVKIESSNHKNAKKFLEDDNYFQYKNNKLKKKPSKKNIFQKKIKIQHFNNHLGNDDSNDNDIDKNTNNTFNQIKSKNINLNLINQYNEEIEENENDEDEEDINKNNNKNNKNFKKEKKKSKKKLDFLSIDELFDLSNYEGEKEAIIDDELHSNDEAVFETKIIPKKKIINDYIIQIKKEVPSINLSQIEFNKAKVINEADLYSLQRRKFDITNIDGRISEMKKKLKKLKNKLDINKQKYISIRNFINEIKDNYNKILRPLKIKSTVEGGNIDFKIQNLIGKPEKNKKNEIKDQKNVIEEELVGSDYSDEDKYEEDDKQNQINIIPDDNSLNENNYNNVLMKTQAEIKTKIKLNLNNKNINEKRKNYKNEIKVNSEDNKYNSK